MSDPLPVHLVERSSDRLTLCGRDIRDRGMPFVLRSFYGAHVEGRGVVACDECAAIAWDAPTSL